MRKSSHFFILSFALLLFIGAGCSTASQKSGTANQAKAPQNTPEQKAYVFCTNKGFTPKVKFSGEANRNKLFCIFEEGKECDAVEFMNGKCTLETLNEAETDNPLVSLTPLEARVNCEAKAVPVCGTDGKTYTNRCIAESQGKTIKYEGVCSEEDEPLETGTVLPVETKKTRTSRTSEPVRTNPKPQPPTQPAVSRPVTSNVEETSPEWVHTLTSLLSESSSPYPITLSQCKEGSNTYYYQKEDCPDCFRILYNNTGEVQCYPGYGENGTCPNFKESSCKQIWKK